MKTILKGVLRVLGAKKMFLLAWDLVKPELEKLAKKTPTELDDRTLVVVDGIIRDLMGDKEVSEYLADSQLHSSEKSSLAA